MNMLSTFFPKHPRPRTVVHAGPLLLTREGGIGALRLYLRIPRRREIFLIHEGQEPLRDAAEDAGVTDIALDTAAGRETNAGEANATTEMALALGARSLDFAIDEPSVSHPRSGDPLREITLNEAESLARNPELRPRIRGKLRAGCAALRHGVSRVRIGDPRALARGQATVLLPDATVPLELPGWGRRDAHRRPDVLLPA